MSKHRVPWQSQTEVPPTELKITGEIPSWVRGKLIRLGPGLFEFGKSSALYPGDGMGLFQTYDICESGVKFSLKFLQSETYKKNLAEERFCHSEFGTEADPDPTQGRLAKLKAKVTGTGEMSDNLNHNVTYWKGNDSILMNGSTFIFSLNKQLDIQHKFTLNEQEAQLLSEHMKIDKDGTCYMLGSHVKGSPRYSIISFPCTGSMESSISQLKIVCTVHGQFKVTPCSHHNFIMTPNYFVIVEMPMEVNIMKILTKSTIMKAIQWEPNVSVKFHVIQRSTGTLLAQKYESPSFNFLHDINAYEQDEHLIIDVFAMTKFKLEDVFSSRIQNADLSYRARKPYNKITNYPIRVVIPLNQQMINSAAIGSELNKLTGETCSAVKQKNHVALQYRQITKPGEDHFYYPCVNARFKGNKYRYYYGTGYGESDFIPNSVARFDLETGEVKRWDGGSDNCPSEPVFITNSEISDQDEDEGVLVTAVIDYSEKKEDRLVFINPKDMTEIASASLLGVTKPDGSPCLIPEADHGIFIGEE